MAQNLSPLQKAALDFMIEAKKADDCFLAISLNNNAANQLVADNYAPAAAAAQQVAAHAVADAAPAHVNAAQVTDWNQAFQLFQHAGDCMNHETFVGIGVNNLGAATAAEVCGGCAPAASAPGAAPKGLSLADLVKLRYGLR